MRYCLLAAAALLTLACGNSSASFPSSAGGGGAGDTGGAAPSSTSATTGVSTSTSGAGGAEAECIIATDCPGEDADCTKRTCTNGICGEIHLPDGIPIAEQVDHDCLKAVCDGAGSVKQAFSPSDYEVQTDSCIADAYCTPDGPVYEAQPNGTQCNDTCACPELNNGVCGDDPNYTCTQGICKAGTCLTVTPVTCKVGNKYYTRCDLTASEYSIGFGNNSPDCTEYGWCACNNFATDVGYCAPGTPCSVSDANGWLGPTEGSGTCI